LKPRLCRGHNARLPGKETMKHGKRNHGMNERKPVGLARRRGVVILEFAAALPFLLVLLLGVTEFGWLMKNNAVIANAAREGARYAARGYPPDKIYARVVQAASPLLQTNAGGGVTNGAIEMKYSTAECAFPSDVCTAGSCKNGVPAKEPIKITVTLKYTPLTSFFGFLKNRAIVASSVMMRI
jgi:Flp pilus assembly protein TadG